MRNATLVFLIKKQGDSITHICLALKKRGFGVNRWNGAGGKVENETVIEAAKREAQEEIGVKISKLHKVAELTFIFPLLPDGDQLVHAYFSELWQGEPSDSDEMAPKWFPVSLIPYQEMWPDDIYWLPAALNGAKIKAQFTFGKNDSILKKEVKILDKI